MKVFALILSTLLLSAATSFAASVDVPSEVTYDEIRNYPDGLTFVETPKLYGMQLGALTIGSTENNGKVFCQKLSMEFYDVASRAISRSEVVNYDISADGKVTGPFFSYAASAVSRVICKRLPQ